MKKFVFLALFIFLCGCTYYSDETLFYYDDANAQPDAAAAPSKPVSSEQLVIPEDLRTPHKASDKSQKATLMQDKTSSAAKANPQNKSFDESSTSAQELIPVTYGADDETDVASVQVSEQATFSTFDVSPQVYAIVATRVTNQMLDDTQKLYSNQENKPKLLVLKTQKRNEALPDGLNYANKTIYDIVSGSQNFVLVDKLDDADFQLEAFVDAAQNPKASTPIIIYTLVLKDKNGKEIDSWTKDIRQLQNDDQSWW